MDFEFKVQMTTDKVNFIPPSLDFGRIYAGTASSRNLKIQNLSDLPQELLFFPLPKNIKIHPDLIPIRLLPKSTIDVQVTYYGRDVLTEDTEMVIVIFQN